MLDTDFWWLSPKEIRQYRYVELFHQEPYPDAPDTDKGPLSYPMLQSDRRYSLESLSQWKAKFANINVFRSFELYSSDANGKRIIGPFLLDIDNQSNDLDDALDVARNAWSLLRGQFNISANNLKIFFTGHKGFNFEVHPQTLGVQGSVNEQIVRFSHFLEQIILGLRGGKSWESHNQVSNARTFIDTIYGDRFGYKLKHPHIRLHHSLNKWVAPDGTTKTRMKIELAIDELNILTASRIISASEKIAT